MNTAKKIICLAWGWTGGHVLPLLALREMIVSASNDYSFIWVGEKGSLESSIARQNNIPFFCIKAGKIQRYASFAVLLSPFLVVAGFVQALFFFATHKVDIVFSKWGHVAFPVVVAAWIFRKKIIIHESDSIPGLVSRISGFFATKVLLGFSQASTFFSTQKTQLFGQILSPRLFASIAPVETSPRTQLLIMWWSQGSRRLFEFIKNYIRELGNFDITLILGTKNEEVAAWFEGTPQVRCVAFCSQEEMGNIYAQTDIAIARSGATTLAELEAFGIHMILVPLPESANGHQLENARIYESQKGQILLLENQLDEKGVQALAPFMAYKKPVSIPADTSSKQAQMLLEIVSK